MAEESVILHASDPETKATAEVKRYSSASRSKRAALLGIGGFAAGTVCILIPIVHLITTWGFPALGIFMAMRAWKREIVILNVQGRCQTAMNRCNLPGAD